MNFCDNCDNMYYIKLNSEDPNKLVYYCRNCGNEDSNITTDNICVLKTNIKKKEQTFNHIINKYTKLDPTLPRVNNVLCPNTTCETNIKETPKEIIYIRYDDTNIKYVYLCSHCDTIWKSGDKV